MGKDSVLFRSVRFARLLIWYHMPLIGGLPGKSEAPGQMCSADHRKFAAQDNSVKAPPTSAPGISWPSFGTVVLLSSRDLCGLLFSAVHSDIHRSLPGKSDAPGQMC